MAMQPRFFIAVTLLVLVPFGSAFGASICHQSNWDHPRHYSNMEWVGGPMYGSGNEFLASYHLRNPEMADFASSISFDRLCVYVYVPSDRGYEVFQARFEVAEEGGGRYDTFRQSYPEGGGYSIKPGEGGYFSVYIDGWGYEKGVYSRVRADTEDNWGTVLDGSMEAFFYKGSNWQSADGKVYSHNGTSCNFECEKELNRYRDY